MKKSKRRLTPEEIEDLTYDLILFCMKWGMWYDGDAAIYCNGKRYCPNFDSEQAGNSFRELEGVQITTESLEDNMPEWVVREQEMSDLVGQKPDHILSMNIDGSLYHVLHDLEYIKKFSALTPEGQAEVLARTSFLDDLEDAVMFWGAGERPDLNPLDVSSYEEYQTLLDILDNRACLYADVKAVLEEKEYIYSGGKHPIIACILREFNEIFRKYDVWYDFKENWWLTCYYYNHNAPERFL